MSYDNFLSMEHREREPGGIDEKTGWRYEWWWIGMTRNASRENCRRLKVFLDPAPHVILDQDVPLRGWYKAKHEPIGTRPRPCYTEALLTQPYGGACPVRCSFCYVNNGLRGYRGQGITVVDPSYPDKIRKQLSRMRSGTSFYISSFTEPFQKLEETYHNTQRLAQVAVDNGLPIFFLTRQVPPGWAIDLLKRNPYSYQQFSINTPSPEDWKRFSPNAAKLVDLLAAVEEIHRQGIYVSIQCNPVMAGITSNDQIAELIHRLASAGANHMIFKFVEIVAPAARSMVEKARKLFPDRSDRFSELFTETIGSLKTIKEEYRIDALNRYLSETKKAGITMGLCYEYRYRRKSDGSIADKTGVSLGPQFTTADQCHGRRVPMFTRAKVTDKFRPFPQCKKTGCLYCAENSGGEALVPCRNPLLAKAKALRPQDYLNPVSIQCCE